MMQGNVAMKIENKRFLNKDTTPTTSEVPVSNPMPEREPPASVDGIRLPAELMSWAADYASRHHTSLNQLVIDQLVELRKRELGLDVEQF